MEFCSECGTEVPERDSFCCECRTEALSEVTANIGKLTTKGEQKVANTLSACESRFNRRHFLCITASAAAVTLAGCAGDDDDESHEPADDEEPDESDASNGEGPDQSEETTTNTIEFEEWLNEIASREQEAIGEFNSAYEIVNSPLDELTEDSWSDAVSSFRTAEEIYEELAEEAEDIAENHVNEDEAEGFELAAEYFDEMNSAATMGGEAVELALEESILDSDVANRVENMLSSMESHREDAQELQKQIALYRDTKDTTPAELVGNWVTNKENDIQNAKSQFNNGTDDFNNREYTTAQDSFMSAGENYASLLEDINLEYTTEYPRESDLYQLFARLSYYFSQMIDVCESTANSARLRSEGDFESAVSYEDDAMDAYPEAMNAWEETREEIEAIHNQFDRPILPQFEEEIEPIESREEAEQIVREWLDENEMAISAQFNFTEIAEENYADEEYEDASDWYSTVAQDREDIEQSAGEQVDEYHNEFIVETFRLIRDYFAALRQVAEKMQQAASARAASRSGEAEALEGEAEEYRIESEELVDEIDSRLPGARSVLVNDSS